MPESIPPGVVFVLLLLAPGISAMPHPSLRAMSCNLMTFVMLLLAPGISATGSVCGKFLLGGACDPNSRYVTLLDNSTEDE